MSDQHSWEFNRARDSLGDVCGSGKNETQKTQRQIVIKHIADKLREAKFLIDNPLEFWRERNPVGLQFGYPYFEYAPKCGEELERIELEIGAYLELAEKLGYISDSGERYQKIWERNYNRLKKFRREGRGVSSWWERD